MAKVILICGKICSGKTRYAKYFLKTNSAVSLSVDEIMIALFGTDVGTNHDLFVQKTQDYLYKKAVEIIESGIDVILDWGFWTQQDRTAATVFFKEHDIIFEWHYMDVSDEILCKNLRKRNREIVENQILFYYFDDSTAKRFWNMFEPPEKSEIDVWNSNQTCIKP